MNSVDFQIKSSKHHKILFSFSPLFLTLTEQIRNKKKKLDDTTIIKYNIISSSFSFIIIHKEIYTLLKRNNYSMKHKTNNIRSHTVKTATLHIFYYRNEFEMKTKVTHNKKERRENKFAWKKRKERSVIIIPWYLKASIRKKCLLNS